MNEIETVNYLKSWAAKRAVELSGDPDEVDFETDKNAKALAEEFREWILPTEDIEYIALTDESLVSEVDEYFPDGNLPPGYDPNNC